MAKMKTQFEELMDTPEARRVFAQESLALEAAELISALMDQNETSKAELARRLGKSKALVTQFLSGSRNMTVHTLADLAFALGHRISVKAEPLSYEQAKVPPERSDSTPWVPNAISLQFSYGDQNRFDSGPSADSDVDTSIGEAA